MSQYVYYVAHPRSSQAYNDARTPNLAEPDKILQRLPKILCRKMFIVLHIPEALRYTMMPGLQPG